MSTHPAPTQPTPVERFNSMLEDLMEAPRRMIGWHPPVDIRETEKKYLFFVDIPGMNKEDLNIELQGEMLIFSGKRPEPVEEKNERYLRHERGSGEFQRTFRLDARVDPQNIKAEYRQGLLMITVPKVAPVKVDKISIL